MGPSTSEWYDAFAEREAAGNSPIYQRLAHAVAAHTEIIGRLNTLPHDKRQPNLLFASVRALGGPIDAPKPFAEWALGNWDALAATMRNRRTQTNEPRRCATLLPFLSSIEGPLALIEVGASAGLCLYPDRWQYRYNDAAVGDADAPLLTCKPVGSFTGPSRLPEVSWRAGIDVNPLDVTNVDDVRWLEALIWPEQAERRNRLHDAIAIAQDDPAVLVAGDLNDDLNALVSQAPSDATLVVFHSAVLTYVTPEKRQEFVDQVTALRGHWISNEGSGVLPAVTAQVPASRKDFHHRFLTALDGRPVAWSGPHGQSIELL
jgi:hypothetical protein